MIWELKGLEEAVPRRNKELTLLLSVMSIFSRAEGIAMVLGLTVPGAASPPPLMAVICLVCQLVSWCTFKHH